MKKSARSLVTLNAFKSFVCQLRLPVMVILLLLGNGLYAKPAFKASNTNTTDGTPPSVTSLYSYSNHPGNTQIAVAGDVISLVLGSDVPTQVPTVTIGGHTVIPVNTGGNNWLATYNVTSADPAGRIGFTVQFIDFDGNSSVVYTDLAAGDDIEVVSTDVALTGLSISAGTLSPAFEGGTTIYKAAVSNAVTGITLTPTATDSKAIITVNSVTVSSGIASGNIALQPGPNTITTVVASADGTNSKTYMLTVTRASASTDATLSGLTFGGGAISPSFSPNTTLYTAQTLSATNVAFTATTTDPGATILIGGAVALSGIPYYRYLNATGVTPVEIVVTAADGATTKTYDLNVTVTGSDVATANIKLSPAAALNITSYSVPENDYTTSVAATTSSITVMTTPDDATSTVTVNGSGVANGAASPPVTLNAADDVPTPVTVVVTAQNSTTKTYKMAVSRNGSSDVTANIKLSPAAILTGTLFTTKENDYTTSVATATSSITVTTTPGDATSTVTVNGSGVANGVASPAITLNAAGGAPTIITTVVTSMSGAAKTYVMAVSRNGSSDAVAGIKLSPAATLTGTLLTNLENDYTTSVIAATSSITVTTTPEDATATVAVNGVGVANGVASPAIALNAAGGQPTLVTVVVTSMSGTAKTYKMTISRNGSSDVSAGIKLSPAATLTGTLLTNQENDYTTSVVAATSSITVTTTPGDATSTVTVNGVAVANGVASPAITLNAAGGQPTIVTTVVTSLSGTSKAYVIAITRPAVAGLALLAGTEIPDNLLAANDGIVVHNGVSPNGDGIDDILRIDGIAAYPANKLSIINRSGNLVYEAKGYDNSTRMFDGHSNKTGALQLPGTYFYSLEYTVDNVVKHKTGFIVLKY